VFVALPLALDDLAVARRVLERRETLRCLPLPAAARTTPSRSRERGRRAEQAAEHERGDSTAPFFAIHGTILEARCGSSASEISCST
jgi:hypothetical protein